MMETVTPVMSVILKAGAVSLRELFSRLGTEIETRRQLAELLKSGAVRVEVIDGASGSSALRDLDIQTSESEEQIAERLAALNSEAVSERVELLPTAKAWRSPFAAA
jgi:hypothetical protein